MTCSGNPKADPLRCQWVVVFAGADRAENRRCSVKVLPHFRSTDPAFWHYGCCTLALQIPHFDATDTASSRYKSRTLTLRKAP